MADSYAFARPRAALALPVAAGLLQSLGNLALYAASAAILSGRSAELLAWSPALALAFALRLGLSFKARAGLYAASSTERRGLRAALLSSAWRAQDQGAPLDRGRFLGLAGDGVNALALYRGLYLPQLLVGVAAPILALGLVALADPVAALILLAFIPLSPLVVGALQSRFRAVSERYRAENARLTERFQEGILALPTLKAFGQDGAYGKAVDEASAGHRKAAMRLLAVNQLLILFLDLGASLGLTLVAAVLAWLRLERGAISAFQAVFIVLCSLELIRPQQLMGAFFFAGGLGRSALKEAKAALSAYPPAQDGVRPDTWRGEPEQTPIALRGLGLAYRYRGAEERPLPALIELRRGVLVGLAGPSGSGKSTVRRLLSGALEASAGGVYADGGKRVLGPEALRRLVSVADQQPYLFSGSLASNLRYAKPEAEDGELLALVRRLGLDSIHGFPENGLNAPVGEEGRLLSGGQRSRLSLARALLKPAPFLILDEPSADLDTETERLVIDLAREEKKRRGVLLISHRAAALGACDELVAMPG